jgi:hypothetical protein
MTRTAIIAMVGLAAYCLLDLAVSLVVALFWRARAVAPSHLRPAVRARRVLQLRLTPVIASLTITLLMVVPAFALFEPMHTEEEFGPLVATCAGIALVRLAAAIATGAWNLRLTRRVEREWLRASTAIESGSAMRAFMIDASSPIVALVGVFRPTLVAARSVIEACSVEEIAAIVGHERGHFEARDNFKRWLMSSLPDTLRHTPIHGEMLDAWHHASEDAADDAATGGDAQARADLAGLLLKVIRLAPNPLWKSAVVSAFVERDGLERRVRRLLQPELEPPAPVALAPIIALALLGAGVVTTLSSPSILKTIFATFETLVAFGR